MALKLDIETIREVARSRGGQLVSKIYINSRTPLKWKCAKGHKWEAPSNSVKGHNNWCPTCALDRSPSKEEVIKIIYKLNKLAKIKGGKLLSTDYKNAMQKLEWKCAKGHIFYSSTNAVKDLGYWCLKCSGKEKLSIEILQKDAAKKGGMIISKVYKNSFSKYKWKCSLGHIWSMKASSVRNGQWCPKCSTKAPLKLDDLKLLAKKRGGILLSKKYMNAHQKLKWQCAEGHIWLADAAHIKYKKTWCLKCAGGEKKSIGYLIEEAKKRGGVCLSKKYTNIDAKYKWKCGDGHVWEARASAVVNTKTWCPKCHIYIKEEICRTTFEQLFNKKFIKERPKWLVNSFGNTMELDGYNKTLGIAFEYHGRHHLDPNHYYYTKKGHEPFSRRIKIDTEKEQVCAANGVKLFIITYKHDLFKLPSIIKKQSRYLKVDTKKINLRKNIDFNKAYIIKSRINEIKKISTSKGGKCLSNVYLGYDFKLDFMCSKKHFWKTTPEAIKLGRWCPKCAQVRRYN